MGRVFSRSIVPLALLLLAAIGPFTTVQAADDPRPNIIFMFTDDQAQNSLGIMGNEHIQTPHTDALARRGVLFNNAFVTTAICCTNRACLLTGQHMYRHGISDFTTPLSAEAFDQTYPALLRKAGYRTGFLGKFAIGNPSQEDPDLCLPADKFDLWYGFPQSISFEQTVDGETRYLTEVMTERAVEFLRAAKPGEPFCLTVAFKEPHGPFSYFDPAVPNPYEGAEFPLPETFTQEDFAAQPEFIRTSLNGDSADRLLVDHAAFHERLQTTYRTISRADMAVGQIMQELENLGLDKNTVVIYSSDHGSLLGEHGLSGKWLMYEASIRVPMIVVDPRMDASTAGTRRDEMALSIDLAPTMLDLAGVEIPDAMQGKSLLPVLRGEVDNWRTRFYYEHTYNTSPPRSPIAKSEGIRTTRWKYIRYPEENYEQLFDLEADPLERHNLASNADHATTLADLRTLCDEAKNTPSP